MTEQEKNEFLQMLTKHVPDLEIEDFSQRAITSFYDFLVFTSTIGLFAGLWRVIEFWVTQRNITTIKINYNSQNGSKIEVEYTKLSQRQAKAILEDNPPAENGPVRLLVGKAD